MSSNQAAESSKPPRHRILGSLIGFFVFVLPGIGLLVARFDKELLRVFFPVEIPPRVSVGWGASLPADPMILAVGCALLAVSVAFFWLKPWGWYVVFGYTILALVVLVGTGFQFPLFMQSAVVGGAFFDHTVRIPIYELLVLWYIGARKDLWMGSKA